MSTSITDGHINNEKVRGEHCTIKMLILFWYSLHGKKHKNTKDSGALVCAQAILEDLLTIRADRDDSRPQGRLSIRIEKDMPDMIGGLHTVF